MSLPQVLLPMLVYLIPIVFFFYMGMDVLLRNPKKVEHRLVSAITGCYLLLFLEEYVRHLLPIEYSPMLVTLWFGNVGAMIPSFGIHFVIKFSGLNEKMPRYVYPYIFYLPLIAVILTLVQNENLFNSHEFKQMGLWKVPVYNAPYFTALTIGVIISAMYIIVLFIGKKHAKTKEQKEIFHLLLYGVLFVSIWTAVFGYIQFGGSLPPYPYIFAGVVWCFFLRITMKRYEFLNFSSKRYETLFNLNPAAIVLVDLSGRIKEANPSAKQMFHHFDLKRIRFFDLLSPEDQHQWERIFSHEAKEIKHMETVIHHRNHKLDVLIDGDLVFVEHEPHFILILRDITQQNENQREIMFLAYHDPLTRLPNRRFFYERIEHVIAEMKEDNGRLAVIVIDLDFFKETNDQYGHKAGDEFLQHVAKIIKETVAQEGMAGRLGGDEFVIYLQEKAVVERIETFVERLYGEFKRHPFRYGGKEIPVEFSAGVSLFPEDGSDIDTLIGSADKAMYTVKRNGGNHFRLSR